MYRKFTVPIPDAPGKMTEKKAKDGSVYIYYEYGRIYHRDRKYTIPNRVCIGKKDPGNGSRMFPNDKYFEYFPDESALDVPEHIGGRSSCLRSGAYVVISFLLKKHKILEWLENRFGEKNGGLSADLASYLLISERNSAQHYPDYAYSHPLFTPDMRIYSDSKVGNLLRDDITRDDIIAFTEWWNKGKDHRRRIYISYDSTNKHCQAGDIDMIEGGHSKSGVDGEPVFNVSVAIDLKERMPLFYEDYLGSIVDVTQLEHMVDKAIGLGYRNIGFVLDRGYFSRSNISYMDDNGYSFIMMVKGRRQLVSTAVLANKGTFENRRACHIWEHSVNGTTVMARIYEGDRRDRFLHIYYSPRSNSLERAAFELMLTKLSAELERLIGKDCSGRSMAKYEKYYDLSYADDRGRHVLVMCSERTDETEREISLCGYFCLISSDRMDASEALKTYKSRDASEKLFASDKTFLGSRTSRIQSESSLRSKTFLEFIALIIRSRFYSCIADHVSATRRKRNYMNVVSVIAELEKIELVRIGDGVYRLDHAITARQKEILSVFGMSSDDMKKSCRDISNRLAAIDSADIRNGVGDADVRDDSKIEDEEEEEWQE